jgi:hypothetical protein
LHPVKASKEVRGSTASHSILHWMLQITQLYSMTKFIMAKVKSRFEEKLYLSVYYTGKPQLLEKITDR